VDVPGSRCAVVALLVLTASAVAAVGHMNGTTTPIDLESCAGVIDRLREASEKAAAAARTASEATAHAARALAKARGDCDLWGTNGLACARARADHRVAAEGVVNSARDFRLLFVALEARVDGAQFSCRPYATTPDIAGVLEGHREYCLMLRSYRDGVLGIVGQLNSSCRSLGLSETECQICLRENYRPK